MVAFWGAFMLLEGQKREDRRCSQRYVITTGCQVRPCPPLHESQSRSLPELHPHEGGPEADWPRTCSHSGLTAQAGSMTLCTFRGW